MNVTPHAETMTRVPTEAEVEWRIFRLSKLGAVQELAVEIAESSVDVHDVERLLTAGCPLELAWEILR